MLQFLIVTEFETFPLPSSQPIKSYPYLLGLFNVKLDVSIVYVAGLVAQSSKLQPSKL